MENIETQNYHMAFLSEMLNAQKAKLDELIAKKAAHLLVLNHIKESAQDTKEVILITAFIEGCITGLDKLIKIHSK